MGVFSQLNEVQTSALTKIFKIFQVFEEYSMTLTDEEWNVFIDLFNEFNQIKEANNYKKLYASKPQRIMPRIIEED